MEPVTPIHVLEYGVRRKGVFLLVDIDGRKLRFYGFKKSQAALNQIKDSLAGRVTEMVKFLTARARAKGETT
jgi:hypothetical protein